MNIQLFTYAINLILGNGMLFILINSFEYFPQKIILHLLASFLALVLLSMLFRYAKRKPQTYKIWLASVFGTFLIPFFSIYLTFIGFGLFTAGWDLLIKGWFYALIFTLIASPLCIPFGLANTWLLTRYAKSQRG